MQIPIDSEKTQFLKILNDENKGLFLDRDGVINFDYGYVQK